MNTTSKQTLHVLEQIVKPIPIGTNLALLQLIWAMISGAFLPARGAVHTALGLAGFTNQEIRRSWTALRHGIWCIDELIDRFRQLVEEEGSWQANAYEGYSPLTVDLTAIWRPRLQSWSSKLYRQLLGKSFVGIGFGLIAQVGRVDGHRLPLLKRIVRGLATENEDALKKRTLQQASRVMSVNEVIVHDGGVTLSQAHQAQLPQFVLRLGSNCTARRNFLPPYKGRGAYPQKGEIVRPLTRLFKGKQLEATPADTETTFELEGRQVTARGWHNVVRADLRVADGHQLFTIWVIDDPRFDGVLLLGTNLPPTVSPKTIYRLYIDRWPVEQIPLVAKQLLGCQRQFVFAPTCCWRLAELAFFVGNLLSWLAATSPAFPSGYWDRYPKKRPVAFDGSWHGLFLQKNAYYLSEFEKSGRSQTIYPRVLRHIVAPSSIS